MEVSQWVPQDCGLKEICQSLAEYQKPNANHSQVHKDISLSQMNEESLYCRFTNE